MKLAFIQHGDYREAVYRFMEGGPEFYHAQRYTVGAVADLVESLREVVVICVRSEPYDEVLPNGVRAIGCRSKVRGGRNEVLATLERLDPSAIVVRSPMTPVLRWGVRRRLRVLPLFADSFPDGGIRTRWRLRQLTRQLNSSAIDWIGNHNVPASRNLRSLGVDSGRIVPYDYPPDLPAAGYGLHEPPRAPYRCMYVGKISRIKGIEECIRAVHELNRRGLDCRLDVVGGGEDIDAMKSLVHHLGLQQRVDFLGTVPHRRITAEMRRRDVVIVPTRRDYNESGPMTINEALAARTPIVASDHPVIAKRVRDGKSARLFRAGDHASLAAALREVLTSPALYHHLSSNAEEAWERLQCPVKWADLVACWVRDRPQDRAWLRARSLASGIYGEE